jgi:hypothetical protein
VALAIAAAARGDGPLTAPPAFHFEPAASTILLPASGGHEARVDSDDIPPDVEATPGSPDAVAALNASPPPAYGKPDTWRWNLSVGAGFHVTDADNMFGVAGCGFTYFIVERVSAEFELNGMHVYQQGDDAIGPNLNLILRWHILAEESWSFYLEGGAGVLLTTEDVPRNGSSFNFTPQLGVGVTTDIGSGRRFFAGLRAHHISNANTFEENPGRDSIFIYAGISFPF